MKLSVIITTLNDPEDCVKTVESIRSTNARDLDIILVDDCSSTPISAYIHEDAHTKIISNTQRCGVGPSRTLGVMAAQSEYVLLTDSHMKFQQHWDAFALRRLEARPNTVHCAVCTPFERQNGKDRIAGKDYYGGTLNVYGYDRNCAGKFQVFEPIWNADNPGDDAEICCVMGAAYFVNRDWFLLLQPLRYLRSWGADETMLSVKTWLAGGDVRMMSSVSIGHRFLTQDQKQPYMVPVGDALYNKIFSFMTLCPRELSDKLLEALQGQYRGVDLGMAISKIKQDWHLVTLERAANAKLFRHDFNWLVQKFSLDLTAIGM